MQSEVSTTRRQQEFRDEIDLVEALREPGTSEHERRHFIADAFHVRVRHGNRDQSYWKGDR